MEATLALHQVVGHLGRQNLPVERIDGAHAAVAVVGWLVFRFSCARIQEPSC